MANVFRVVHRRILHKASENLNTNVELIIKSEECVCKLCGCAGVEKYHLLRCVWANCG